MPTENTNMTIRAIAIQAALILVDEMRPIVSFYVNANRELRQGGLDDLDFDKIGKAQALALSVLKWEVVLESNSDHRHLKKTLDGGWDTCALCRKYMTLSVPIGKDCQACPIFEKTKTHYCNGFIPYKAYHGAGVTVAGAEICAKDARDELFEMLVEELILQIHTESPDSEDPDPAMLKKGA